VSKAKSSTSPLLTIEATRTANASYRPRSVPRRISADLGRRGRAHGKTPADNSRRRGSSTDIWHAA
jgi:hypothetical protein